MNARNLWITVGRRLSTWSSLLAIATLTACIAPTSLVNSPTDATSGDSATNDSASNEALESSEAAAQARFCERPEVPLEPLSAPDDTPVFEQFNFQPQSIAVSADGVKIDTSYHTFSYCKSTGEWAIANRSFPGKSAFDYEQYLQELAEPNYETLQINNQTYAYRVRLEAPWIAEYVKEQFQKKQASQEQPSQEQASANTDTISEEAVYFELKSPNGSITTHQLYTLSDVQNASLGASLGVPSITGVVETEDAIWFAATTSQGEGENGFASLLRYDLESKNLAVHQPPEIQGDQITSLAFTPPQTQDKSVADPPTEASATEASVTENQPAEEKVTEAEPVENNATNNNPPTEASATEASATENQPAENPLVKNKPTLWLGTLRSGEGNPSFPASGLVAYQPTAENSGVIRQYTITNSPLVGAIPYQVSTLDEELWIATGNGVCQTQWPTIDEDSRWRCWRFTATAAVPSDGVALYPSFLSEEPATQLKESKVEVLWANWEHFDQPDVDKANAFRYEVVYAPGFEATLAQGGYRVESKVAQRMARDNDVFWPGQHWHWSGRRFARSLDEVALNLVGGGPQGLMASNIRTGFSFDHYAIRGDFDLLSLKPDGTQVRYYSGWVDGMDLEAYPDIVDVEPLKETAPDPMDKIAADLPPVGP
ncbi:MAG: hypothetical protein AAF703_11610 [Cyanobacteria bacterium P01_D01_bin.105]